MKISVITSAYNAEKTLQRTIDSVLSQSFTDFEYLIVDHGATDKTAEIIDFNAKNDPRIKKLVIEKNEGYISTALNFGISQSKGTFFSILDADDVYFTDFLQTMYESITKNQADIAICGFDMVDENENLLNRVQFPESCLDDKHKYREFFSDIVVQTLGLTYFDLWWNKLYRKDYIQKYDVKFDTSRQVLDALFNQKLYKHLPKVISTNYVGLTYLSKNVNSMSNQYYTQQYEEYLLYCECWFQLLTLLNVEQKLWTTLRERYFICYHYMKIVRSNLTIEETLKELEQWAFSPPCYKWTQACISGETQLNELDLTLRILKMKHGAVSQAVSPIAKYYNLLYASENTESFHWCLDFILEDSNWFGLSTQKLIDDILEEP